MSPFRPKADIQATNMLLHFPQRTLGKPLSKPQVTVANLIQSLQTGSKCTQQRNALPVNGQLLPR
jgi:hypothetical protein